jgi:hypothetical protein
MPQALMSEDVGQAQASDVVKLFGALPPTKQHIERQHLPA